MNNKEILLKEIDLIQACISKVEQNSFVVKGWSISIVAVVLALFPEELNQKFIGVTLAIIIISFWLLDAFFLRVDRLYRWKYDWIIKNRPNSDEYFFDMDPYNSDMWNLDKRGRVKKEPHILNVMLSTTLLIIYLPLLCLSIATCFSVIK